MKPCWILFLAALSLTAGCDRFPQDSDRTLDRIAGGGQLRVALVHAGPHTPRLAQFVRQLGDQTGSKVRLTAGPAEPALMKLETGRIDLVVGLFDRRSPWEQRVTFSQPIAHTGEAGLEHELKAAVRNGEHAWAMEVDRAVAATRRSAR